MAPGRWAVQSSGVIGHGCILGVEPHRRRVEQRETFIRHSCHHLGGDAAPGRRFADGQQPARARNACKNRRNIQGLDRAQVDYLDLHPLRGHDFGSGQRLVDHCAVSHQRGVPPVASDPRLPGRQDFLCRQLIRLEMIIEELVLAEDHGIVDLDRLEQHPISILDGGRRHHHQPWIMGVDGLHALRVEGAAAGRAAAGQADHERAGDLRAPEVRRRLVDDLAEADAGEIGELHLDDRAHPLDGRADAEPHRRILADRRIHHAAGVGLCEPLRRLERSAERADILPVNEDARIVR